MKHFLIAVAAIPITIGNASADLIDDLTCITDCDKILQLYCCETGQMQWNCPEGWHASGTTCTRDQTTGSDDIGYYTQTYGTCDASRLPCYKGSNVPIKNSDGRELCKKQVGGGDEPVIP